MTENEKQIVNCLVEDPAVTSKEIAGILNKSEQTVRNTLSKIYKKAKVDGKDQLVTLF